MKYLPVILCLGLFPVKLVAGGKWNFNEKIEVSGLSGPAVFHHLDGAGRKHIAVSRGNVAVIWEDNHATAPQVYVAVKPAGRQKFIRPNQLSTGQEGYEPAITGLSGGQFAAAWEQDSAVHIVLLDQTGKATARPLKLSSAPASHVSIAAVGTEVVAVWREQQAQNWALKTARLQPEGDDNLQVLSSSQIENRALPTPVLFPSIAATGAGICVAWEDRRSGHTRLLFSFSRDGALTFSPPDYLNEFQSNRNEYDKGSGVTRVSLSALGEDEVLAAWMDKRRSHSGYGIYASIGNDGGESFGPNEKVHGREGDKLPHYNPSTAGNLKGDFVIAWDDFRSGNSDIWLAAYDENGEWGENIAPPVASGAAEQSHASIALDEQGGLHMLWIERADTLSPTRLWYSHAIAR